MQPTLRQVPPTGPLSTRAVSMPWASASSATMAPEPDPMTTTSYSFMVSSPFGRKAPEPGPPSHTGSVGNPASFHPFHPPSRA